MEVTRIVTDWLRRPDARGYVGCLTSLPRDVNDEPAPAVTLIACPYDATPDGNAAAAFKEPGRLPAIYVTPDGPITAEGEVATVTRDAERVGVAIRYITRGADAKARIESAYAVRAIVKSLREMLRQDATANDARTRSGVYIRLAQSIAWSPWVESIGTAQAVAVVGVDFAVRDKAP